MLRSLHLSKALGSRRKLHCLISVANNCSREPELRTFSNFSQTNVKTLNSKPQFGNSGVILFSPNVLASFSPLAVRCMTSESAEASRSVGDLAESIHETIVSTGSSVPDVLVEPTFHSLGLAHAYPSGWIQALMEQVHIHTDLPWWGTIVGTTFLIRILLIPVVIKAQKNMVALNNVLPEFQRRQLMMNDDNLTREEKLQAHRELRVFMKENNVNPVVTYMPMVCQAAVFMSMFFALRGMATCPVESMQTGGLFWFVDLTMKDPYYALPLVTCGSGKTFTETFS